MSDCAFLAYLLYYFKCKELQEYNLITGGARFLLKERDIVFNY